MKNYRIYRKNVSDAEIKQMMNPHIAELMKDVVPRIIIEKANNKKTEDKKGNKKQEPKKGFVTEKEKELLKSIYEEPDLNIKERTAKQGYSIYEMNQLKTSITRKKLAEKYTVNKGKATGGLNTLLALTDNGYKAIGKKPKIKKNKTTSNEHLWWQRNILKFYKNMGIECEIEKSIDGVKRADVGIVINEKSYAIEVELRPTHGLSNIIGDLNSGFDRVISCCSSKPVANAIKKQLETYKDYDSIKDKVEIKLLTDFSFLKD